MRIFIDCLDKRLAIAIQDIIRLFYPEVRVTLEPNDQFDITISVSVGKSGKKLFGWAELNYDGTVQSETVYINEMIQFGDELNQGKRLVKQALLRLLCRYTGMTPGPWGILTGIRPTKIVHRLFDLNWETGNVIQYLRSNYDVSTKKASLISDIAIRQRPYLLNSAQARKLVSIYIGIPFCPTRCAYCSFPAYSVEKSEKSLGSFMKALYIEISAISAVLDELHVKVQTIYVGGGTPTVLDNLSLRELLKHIKQAFISKETVEITLEAGRPDTIDEEKLRTALEFGVSRLSINPQSMNSHTLRVIGRRHTPEEVIEAVELARRVGFKNINTDIIVGLPGEKIRDIENTLNQICLIKPENLTVHTLAVKRASQIKEEKEQYTLPAGNEVEMMLEQTANVAGNMGMHSYYLYRQKNILGLLENTGYALPGFDCLYNIQIIEERQTIIGLGGGAGSKFVKPGTWYLTSHYNPKDPGNYAGRIDDLVHKKAKMIRDHFTVFKE